MTTVHVVVPDSIDDPARPSGGNHYDRRVCRGLEELGWSVRVHPVPGAWPSPGAPDRTALAGVFARIPEDALALVDGLVASAVPEVLVPAAHRLRIVVLVHMPLGDAHPSEAPVDAGSQERAVLSAAAGVVTTSRWTRRLLIDRYALPPARVEVAEPGVDVADLATGSDSGGELLCVAAVAPHKGHDVLIAALARVRDLTWRCTCVGSLDRDPIFVERLRRQAEAAELDDRVELVGPRIADELDASYAAADVLVVASHAETYGMVVTEALARGLPVVATAAGGLSEALGRGAAGCRPGLLVPPGDPAALAAALREWLVHADLRARLRRAALERRASLSGWSTTAGLVSRALDEAAA